jgi:hypothetical protein
MVTPKKLLPAAWQLAQLAAIPAWFIGVPPNVVKLLAAWQTSHGAGVGMWFAGGVFMVTPKKLEPAAWHVAQLAVIPAWFIAVPLNVVKLLAA